MPTVLLRVAYDGTRFYGWSRQSKHRSVEETLARALTAVDEHAGSLKGMSRTDSGVHAEAQYVAFEAVHTIPPRGWVLSVNRHLPDDMAVRDARIVTPGFDPRFMATKKRYRYRLLLDRVRDPMRGPFSWRVGGDLDIEQMKREAAHLLGTHDFAAFRSARDERDITVRTLTRVSVEYAGRAEYGTGSESGVVSGRGSASRGHGPSRARAPQPVVSGERGADAQPEHAHAQSAASATGDELHVVVEGKAFLYNMVRIIVGTLVDIGRGHRPPGTMLRALEERDRAITGLTAPAHGLCLEYAELALPPETSEPWPH